MSIFTRNIESIFFVILLVLIGSVAATINTNHRPSFEADDEQVEQVAVVEEKPAPVLKTKKVQTTDLNCLASNIYFEAGSEPIEGKIAVANVTLNRVKTRDYPNTVCGVVYARNEKHCAFSWTCDDKDDEPKKSAMYSESMKIASLALKGLLHDITDGADHFHATYVKPQWTKHMTATTQIGGHVFYRKKKASDFPNE